MLMMCMMRGVTLHTSQRGMNSVEDLGMYVCVCVCVCVCMRQCEKGGRKREIEMVKIFEQNKMHFIYRVQNTLSHTVYHIKHTCDTSSVIHMLLAISGERAKAARVNKISALRSLGTGHPTRPKREATGSQD